MAHLHPFSARVLAAVFTGLVAGVLSALLLLASVEPDPATLHQKEAKLVLARHAEFHADAERRIREATGRGDGRSNVWVWPAEGALTGWFGEPRGHRVHHGMDVDGATGDPVVAAYGGTVTYAGWEPPGYGGYGNIVLIDHGDGLETLYSHLHEVLTAAGQEVSSGVQIGTLGNTGVSFGDHLHFEVRQHGVAANPQDWLPAR